MIPFPFQAAGSGLVLPSSVLAPTTWNPADTACTLSNGNLTAVRSGGGSNYNSVRANNSISGKRYWEGTTTWGGSGSRAGIGIATTAMVLNSATQYVGFNATDCGCWGPNNQVFVSASATGRDFTNSPTTPTGTTYKFAFDSTTGKLWIGTVALGWFTGDPETDTSPTVTMGAGTYFPAFTGASGNSDSVTANFGATAFAGAVPSGYAAMP